MLTNITEIKDKIHQLNVRDIVATELSIKPIRATKYDRYPCPFHHEKRGTALTVYPTRWMCWGKCSDGGDAIKFIELHHNFDFIEAIEYMADRYLSGAAVSYDAKQCQTRTVTSTSEPPSSEWQQAAAKVMAVAQNNLWDSQIGNKARHYLQERGLNEETIRWFKLGYIPGHYKQWKKIDGLNIPCGIIIPWLADGAIWGMKVRRAYGQPKYVQVAGGNIAGCLYNADAISAGKSVIAFEGEFDCMIAYQHCCGASSVALGSASNTNINIRWYHKLMTTKSLIALMDNDAAGNAASAKLGKITNANQTITMPEPYKDLNEMLVSAGIESTESWLSNMIGEPNV